jgi:hypothetical protein
MTRHLIHIGVPKSGSTFLQTWFERHPQLAYVPGGFAGFRDVYALTNETVQPRGEVRYRVTSHEGFTAPRRQSASGAIDYEDAMLTHIPALQSAVCETLEQLFPSAWVLIVTRGFRGVILSSFSQYARTGGTLDLRDLLAQEHPIESDPWHYDAIVANYRRAFGRNQVIVMPYELLRDDPSAFLKTLEQRLGIDAFEVPLERENRALSSYELAWYPRLTRFVRRLRSRTLWHLYVEAIFRNRPGPLIAALQWLHPQEEVTAATIPAEVLERHRGRADSLREDPIYAPYADDYLW